MARAGGERNLARPGQEDNPSVILANLQGARSRYTSSTIDYLEPCTATDDGQCHIFRRLSLWNEFLSEARLELRHHAQISNRLSLATIAEMVSEFSVEEQLHRGVSLAYWLLKTHQCVVTVEVNGDILKEYTLILVEGLRRNNSISVLKVVWCPDMSKRCLDTYPPFLPPGVLEASVHWVYPLHLVYEISMLIIRTASLTHLDISSLDLPQWDAAMLLPALWRTRTLKELSLCGSFLNTESQYQLQAFRDYMLDNTALTSLTVTGSLGMRYDVFMLFLYCLQKNRTLVRVSLRHVQVDEESALAVAEIIKSNEILRIFNIEGMKAHRLLARPISFLSWLHALTKNRTLENFTLPINAGSEEQWEQFFVSLTTMTNLNKVTIEFFPEFYRFVLSLQELLADCGAGKKVWFQCLDESVEREESWQCQVWLQSRTLDAFLNIMQRHSTLAHITSAQVLVSMVLLDETLVSALSFYIRGTRTLKKLQLRTEDFETPAFPLAEFWKEITESLSQNTSLTELSLDFVESSEEITQAFAVLLKARKNIHSVDFNIQEIPDYSAFIQELSVGIEENYTILSVKLGDPVDDDLANQWFLIQDTARRNCGLLKEAAEFASHVRRDRSGARALELMSRHSALLERISQLASVSEASAVDLIQESLMSARDLNSFMRFAGVVKERVECHPSRDGRPQLDSLGEYCWKVIRQHLLLDDIRV